VLLSGGASQKAHQTASLATEPALETDETNERQFLRQEVRLRSAGTL
jgi:hypothetical protein